MSELPFFADRHIGPDADELEQILAVLGVSSLDELAANAVPAGIADSVDGEIAAGLALLPEPLTEEQATVRLRDLADRNTVRRSMIGLGYYGTHTPGVIRRNILENPAWYTAYTPYQPEISQGRLEALLNFQTMVTDLTGMTVANASMLDEATAAAEAMTLLLRATKNKSRRLIVDADVFPQTLAVIETRAEPLGIEVIVAELDPAIDGVGLPPGDFYGVITQVSGASGRLVDSAPIIAAAHERDAMVAVGVDLLAATLLESPGQQGADACFGTSQRFGVSMGFGGPHAGFLAVTTALTRPLPGRLVGVSKDAD